MSRGLVNGALAALLVALLAGGFFHGDLDEEARNVEFLPTMVHSVPYDAYSAHSQLPGGMTMQTPPPGTIARGRLPLHFGPGPEEAARAGAELESPLEDGEEHLERGREMFGIYCLLCHGPEGRGDGPVSQRGFPAPPSFDSETSAALAEGQIFHIVSFGQNNMPGHASQIDPDDRWRIVQHVRALRADLLADLAEGSADAESAAAPQEAPP